MIKIIRYNREFYYYNRSVSYLKCLQIETVK